MPTKHARAVGLRRPRLPSRIPPTLCASPASRDVSSYSRSQSTTVEASPLGSRCGLTDIALVEFQPWIARRQYRWQSLLRGLFLLCCLTLWRRRHVSSSFPDSRLFRGDLLDGLLLGCFPRGFFQRFLDRAKFFANLSAAARWPALRDCFVLRGTVTFAARVEPCVAN